MEGHVDRLLSSCGSSLYALSLLRAHGMQAEELQEIFRSKVLSRLMYASQAWWGFAQSYRNAGMETTSHTTKFRLSSTRANVLVTALSHVNLSLLCVNKRMIICSDILLLMRILFFSFFNTIFVSSHMYPENPEGTQVIVGSMNMGYDIYPTLPGIELIPKTKTNHQYVRIRSHTETMGGII